MSSKRWWLVLLPLLGLGLVAGWLGLRGCEGTRSDELIEASHRVNFESVTALGPHRLEVVHGRRVMTEPPQRSVEVLIVRWGDYDNFRVVRLTDGRPTTETRVVQGVPWSRSARGRFREGTDPEIHRVELSQTWNVWQRALEPFAARIQFELLGTEVVEGRDARRYAISATPLEEGHVPEEGEHVVESLEGFVVIDAATAVRLLAEVSGEYLDSGDPDERRDVRLKLTRSQIGEIPRLATPEEKRRRRR